MSESPPPPPPPEPNESAGPVPDPPPYGQAPASGSTSGQVKDVFQGAHRFDLGIVGAGILGFLASLLPFYTVSFGDVSASRNAWDGFFGWFGALLLLGAAGVLAAHMFAKVAIPSLRLLVLGLAAGAALCMILALFVMPGGGYDGIPGYSTGHGFGYWLALLCSIGAAALAFLRKDATD